MFNPGDLVIISDDCDIEYFGGKTAIIVKNVGQDATDHSHGFYYQLHFADGKQHIFVLENCIYLPEDTNSTNSGPLVMAYTLSARNEHPHLSIARKKPRLVFFSVFRAIGTL